MTKWKMIFTEDASSSSTPRDMNGRMDIDPNTRRSLGVEQENGEGAL